MAWIREENVDLDGPREYLQYFYKKKLEELESGGVHYTRGEESKETWYVFELLWPPTHILNSPLNAHTISQQINPFWRKAIIQAELGKSLRL
jgi:hypothetical protein